MPVEPFGSAQDRRFSPDDPREWLNRARSNLARARSGATIPGVYLEDLCFDAHQAAEKALKAVLIHLDVSFPYVHDLARPFDKLRTPLLTLVKQAGREVPASVRQAARLTRYAVVTRYPGLPEPVVRGEYEEAVSIAAEAIRWAEEIIRGEARRGGGHPFTSTTLRQNSGQGSGQASQDKGQGGSRGGRLACV